MTTTFQAKRTRPAWTVRWARKHWKEVARERVKDSVSEGGFALDEQWPGWVDRMDLVALDINDGKVCVLGQLLGCFSKAPSLMRDYAGFGPFGDELTRAWRAYITLRWAGEL